MGSSQTIAVPSQSMKSFRLGTVRKVDNPDAIQYDLYYMNEDKIFTVPRSTELPAEKEAVLRCTDLINYDAFIGTTYNHLCFEKKSAIYEFTLHYVQFANKRIRSHTYYADNDIEFREI